MSSKHFISAMEKAVACSYEANIAFEEESSYKIKKYFSHHRVDFTPKQNWLGITGTGCQPLS